MRNNPIAALTAAAMLLLGPVQPARATGALFVRPLFSNQTYRLMRIQTYDAAALIQDQIAQTHIDQTFFNDSDSRVEATFVFPLPEGAVITELVYWFNGQRYVASVREKQEAREAYNRRIRQLMDPALLEYLGDNLFKLNIAPINAKSQVRFEITYVELLPYAFGSIEYRFLLKATGLSPQPLERISVQIAARTASSFKNFSVVSHDNSTALNITRNAPDDYSIVYGDENFTPSNDLLLRFETFRDEVDMHVITYMPTVQDSFGTDGFFALWITPPDSITASETIPKNIVFTADVSSSMEGSRMLQLKQALHAFLANLQAIDRFNIITFGTSVAPFRADLVPASTNELAAAESFINSLSAVGLTNIDAALKQSLAMSFGDNTANMIVFLTDGYPTWGETDPVLIADSAAARNVHNVRIFPFGIGDDVSKPLLINLARRNGGYPTYITSDDSIALVVGNHFARISRPVMSDLSLNFGGLQTYDRYPAPLPDLFWGSQVMQFGRYLTGGVRTVALSGDVGGKPFSLQKTVAFPETQGGNRAVARLWASSKINYLLEQIALLGEQEELVNAVIDLSIRFGILTPYTALYSDPTDDDPTNPGTAVTEGTDRLLPTRFTLLQNYPNPFNPETKIVFFVPPQATSRRVTLKIYDILGRLVRVLFDREVGPGRYVATWDGKDALQRDLPSGTYIYELVAGKVKISKRMQLLR